MRSRPLEEDDDQATKKVKHREEGEFWGSSGATGFPSSGLNSSFKECLLNGPMQEGVDDNLMEDVDIVRCKEDRWICLVPAPVEWMKLNSNGSFKGESGNAYRGGLIRDLEERWVVGYILNLGESTVTGAEPWAFVADLNVAWDFVHILSFLPNEIKSLLRQHIIGVAQFKVVGM
ncbi:hypothetical protein GH714_011128 [Hevea brasiliensis]|uniref:RNase H type-1 domain-containing protein n=1 Tax=Hevea brasiliensis TaxID=3981 RepID=A0A6A6KU65_HEVBR|nr:hypothetical protein GH714_011128 [Hevea brasiliensis]